MDILAIITRSGEVISEILRRGVTFVTNEEHDFIKETVAAAASAKGATIVFEETPDELGYIVYDEKEGNPLVSLHIAEDRIYEVMNDKEHVVTPAEKIDAICDIFTDVNSTLVSLQMKMHIEAIRHAVIDFLGVYQKALIECEDNL